MTVDGTSAWRSLTERQRVAALRAIRATERMRKWSKDDDPTPDYIAAAIRCLEAIR